MLWLVACLLANFFVQFVDLRSLGAFSESLSSQNLIFWLACYVVVERVRRSDAACAPHRFEVILLVATASLIFLTSLIPHKSAIGALTTVAGLCLLTIGYSDRNLRAAGAVLLALSGHLLWAPAIFQFFTSQLLQIDAALVGTLLAKTRPDIVWNGTSFHAPGGHSIALVAACSSFHNVSSAMLASVAVTMFLRTSWVFRRDLLVMLALCCSMILMNVMRLGLLASSQAAYQYWHQDVGASILSLLQTATIALLAYWGAQPSERSA